MKPWQDTILWLIAFPIVIAVMLGVLFLRTFRWVK